MQIEVVQATSTATRCAYCRDDLCDVPENRCRSCTGLAHPDCVLAYGRCPVWGCRARSEDHGAPSRPVTQAITPTLPPAQPPEPARVVETAPPAARRTGARDRLWTHTFLHIAVGSVILIILFLTHPPTWLVVTAITAFIIMAITDPREEEAS